MDRLIGYAFLVSVFTSDQPAQDKLVPPKLQRDKRTACIVLSSSPDSVTRRRKKLLKPLDHGVNNREAVAYPPGSAYTWGILMSAQEKPSSMLRKQNITKVLKGKSNEQNNALTGKIEFDEVKERKATAVRGDAPSKEREREKYEEGNHRDIRTKAQEKYKIDLSGRRTSSANHVHFQTETNANADVASASQQRTKSENLRKSHAEVRKSRKRDELIEKLALLQEKRQQAGVTSSEACDGLFAVSLSLKKRKKIKKKKVIKRPASAEVGRGSESSDPRPQRKKIRSLSQSPVGSLTPTPDQIRTKKRSIKRSSKHRREIYTLLSKAFPGKVTDGMSQSNSSDTQQRQNQLKSISAVFEFQSTRRVKRKKSKVRKSRSNTVSKKASVTSKQNAVTGDKTVSQLQLAPQASARLRGLDTPGVPAKESKPKELPFPRIQLESPNLQRLRQRVSAARPYKEDSDQLEAANILSTPKKIAIQNSGKCDFTGSAYSPRALSYPPSNIASSGFWDNRPQLRIQEWPGEEFIQKGMTMIMERSRSAEGDIRGTASLNHAQTSRQFPQSSQSTGTDIDSLFETYANHSSSTSIGGRSTYNMTRSKSNAFTRNKKKKHGARKKLKKTPSDYKTICSEDVNFPLQSPLNKRSIQKSRPMSNYLSNSSFYNTSKYSSHLEENSTSNENYLVNASNNKASPISKNKSNKINTRSVAECTRSNNVNSNSNSEPHLQARNESRLTLSSQKKRSVSFFDPQGTQDLISLDKNSASNSSAPQTKTGVQRKKSAKKMSNTSLQTLGMGGPTTKDTQLSKVEISKKRLPDASVDKFESRLTDEDTEASESRKRDTGVKPQRRASKPKSNSSRSRSTKNLRTSLQIPESEGMSIKIRLNKNANSDIDKKSLQNSSVDRQAAPSAETAPSTSQGSVRQTTDASMSDSKSNSLNRQSGDKGHDQEPVGDIPGEQSNTQSRPNSIGQEDVSKPELQSSIKSSEDSEAQPHEDETTTEFQEKSKYRPRKMRKKDKPPAPRIFYGWDGGKPLAPHNMTSLPEFSDVALMLLQHADKQKEREFSKLTDTKHMIPQPTHSDTPGEYLAKYGLDGLFVDFTSSFLKERPIRPTDLMLDRAKKINTQAWSKDFLKEELDLPPHYVQQEKETPFKPRLDQPGSLRSSEASEEVDTRGSSLSKQQEEEERKASAATGGESDIVPTNRPESPTESIQDQEENFSSDVTESVRKHRRSERGHKSKSRTASGSNIKSRGSSGTDMRSRAGSGSDTMSRAGSLTGVKSRAGSGTNVKSRAGSGSDIKSVRGSIATFFNRTESGTEIKGPRKSGGKSRKS